MSQQPSYAFQFLALPTCSDDRLAAAAAVRSDHFKLGPSFPASLAPSSTHATPMMILAKEVGRIFPNPPKHCRSWLFRRRLNAGHFSSVR